jgi:predicted MFS family arabinose efflux permease
VPTTASVPINRLTSRPTSARSHWPAVFALMGAIFVLVTAEFLPTSLLPAMAKDFGVTEGVAGQVVTATALVGMVAGPGTALLFPRMDRRRLLLGLLLLALVANVVTAIAPIYAIVFVARLALGAAIAGTWSMALAVTSQLVPREQLGRAMMTVNIGVSAATVAAVPLGALISSLAGWRSVFWAVAAATAVAFVVFLLTVPPITAAENGGLRPLVDALKSKVLIVGFIGLAVFIASHFASYTFIRGAAESMSGLAAGEVALLLATYGVGGVVGNLLVGVLVDRRIGLTMLLMPLLIGIGIISFVLADASVVFVFAAAAVWGLGFGAVPTVAQTWVSRAEPNRVEAGGGLIVATLQLAIALGAAVGGIVIDGAGVHPLFLASGIVVLIGGAIFASTRRLLPR